MKTNHIITLNVFITLLLLGAFYYAINQYGTQFLSGVWDKNGVTRVINQKVIQENVSEYRKLSDTQSDVTKAIQSVIPSVVHLVRSADITGNGSGGIISSIKGGGSAIIITSDGYLITNKHVVSNLQDKYVAITNEGKRLAVSNIRHDPVLDIAVLRVTDVTGNAVRDLPAAAFVSHDSTINLGQFAIALGSSQTSLDFVQKFSTVSQKNIAFNVTSGDTTVNIPYFRIDAAVYPGFSGGPTIDLQGNVIGITTAMDNGTQQGGLVLPLTKEFVQQTLADITAKGRISRVSFGISTIALNSNTAQQLGLKKFSGWYVQRVTTGSIASEAGIMKGDVIMQIDGKDISGDFPFSRYRLGYGSGDSIDLTIHRDNTTKSISLTLH